MSKPTTRIGFLVLAATMLAALALAHEPARSTVAKGAKMLSTPAN